MVLGDLGVDPGTPLTEVIPVTEHVLELDLNPNRSDCLGVYGVAREVHAITGAPLAPAPWETDADATGDGTVDELASVTVEVPELCPRFTARVFTGVEMGPSPLWLRARLSAAGQRPISNIVDITNYVMLLVGQPLHAYDLDRVTGHELIVRAAGDGERITTLDGVERTLDPEMVLITDQEKPAGGIAGVMGGQVSEVSDATDSGAARGGNLERAEHPDDVERPRTALGGVHAVREAAPPGAGDARPARRVAADLRACGRRPGARHDRRRHRAPASTPDHAPRGPRRRPPRRAGRAGGGPGAPQPAGVLRRAGGRERPARGGDPGAPLRRLPRGGRDRGGRAASRTRPPAAHPARPRPAAWGALARAGASPPDRGRHVRSRVRRGTRLGPRVPRACRPAAPGRRRPSADERRADLEPALRGRIGAAHHAARQPSGRSALQPGARRRGGGALRVRPGVPGGARAGRRRDGGGSVPGDDAGARPRAAPARGNRRRASGAAGLARRGRPRRPLRHEGRPRRPVRRARGEPHRGSRDRAVPPSGPGRPDRGGIRAGGVARRAAPHRRRRLGPAGRDRVRAGPGAPDRSGADR